MTWTLKRWCARFVLGTAGITVLSVPAFADGWLRGRLHPHRPAPTIPWVEPSAPVTPPSAIPAPLPPTVTDPAPPMTKIPPAPAIPEGPMVPAEPPEPRFEPLISAALGEAAVAVSFQPAMFGDQTSGGTVVPIDNRVGNGDMLYNDTRDPLTPNGTPENPAGDQNNQNQRRRRPLVRFPIVSYAAFKIAENESPRPTDRVYATYSFFDGVATGSASPRFDVHRATVGFEKTLLDGRASIGVRVPFLQLDGPGTFFNDVGVNQGQVGDITVITKYAFYDDRTTGNLLSGGLAVTAPTGEDFRLADGSTIHCVLLQPWTGFIWNFDNLFFHGFSSVVVPTDSRDVTAWYNDIGVGYWLRREQRQYFFHGIVPTAEVHVGTPLNHRDYFNEQEVYMANFVSILGGCNFVFARNSTIGFAAGAPVTGPRPWQFESHVSINFRF